MSFVGEAKRLVVRIMIRKILERLIGARLALVVSREQVRRGESFGAFALGCLGACFGYRAPNTALEPTADSALGLSGSVRLAIRQFGGGSAFVR